MSEGKSMKYRCNCGGKLYVQETRASADAIYRVRKCKDCGWLFNTREVAVEDRPPTTIRDPRIGKRNES